MKRNVLMIAVAIIALSSCNKDTIKDVNGGYSIDFRVSTQTRASEVTTANLAAFNVTAIDASGKNYFTDVLFSKSGDFFISNPEYYWPGTGDLAFYAYAPVDLEDVSVNNTSQVVSGFTPSTSIADQQDFVVATATGNKSTNETDGVQLTFQHKLAQIGIRAKNANSAYKYYIKGVKIANVISSADFNFSPKEGDSEWTYDVTQSTSSYSIEYTKPMDTPLGIVGTNLMCSVSADESGAEVLDYSVGNAMLIPQQLAAWDKTTNTTGSYLAVLAKVETADGSVVYPKDASTSGEEYDWLLVPVDTKWEAGNRYVYTLDFTEGAGLDEDGNEVLGGPVKFKMDVEPWDETSTAEIVAANFLGKWEIQKVETWRTPDPGYTLDEDWPAHAVYTDDDLDDPLKMDQHHKKIDVISASEYEVYPDNTEPVKYQYSISNNIFVTSYKPQGFEQSMSFLIRESSADSYQFYFASKKSQYYLESVYYYKKVEEFTSTVQ